jgi:hypothetical protein
VIHSSDMFLFSQKLNEDILKIKNAVGDQLVQNDDADLAI